MSEGEIVYASGRIRNYVTATSVRALVNKVIAATCQRNQKLLELEEYIPQCINQIKHKTSQYIRKYQGIAAPDPDQVFEYDTIANQIQVCIGSSVADAMDRLVQRIEAADRTMKTFRALESIIWNIMRPMLERSFDQEVVNTRRKSTDSEYVWTAIGKLATIIDRYNNQRSM